MSHRGLQAEILISLSTVMLTATAILGLLLLHSQEARVEQLRPLAARSLRDVAGSPLRRLEALSPGVRWWTSEASGRLTPAGGDEATEATIRQLAGLARERGAALLRSGPPWQPVRFAAPVGSGGAVAIAELPAVVSLAWILGLVAVDVIVFTALGMSLLGGRVVRPLQRLAASARAIGEGSLGTRAPVAGVRETREVAAAFNEMSEALERRSRELEKAVAELRESNRELREARAGLDRAERLAAVGRLASGVAHEVGNPMGAILAFLDLAGRDLEPGSRSHGYLERAARQGERIRSILRQLLQFSRPPRAARDPLDVTEVCRETAGLVQAQSRYAGIRIEIEEEGEPPQALGDVDALSQILLNLLLNAADALAGRPDPRIRLWIAPGGLAVRAGDDPRAAAKRRNPDAVVCRVVDNGPGVAPEDRERIFDPFFTTRAPGEGTGLGLANAVRLVEEMGGVLELEESEPGEGACFTLRLPVAGGTSGSEVRADA